MPITHTNDVDLFYEDQGTGEPIVLVHGSWDEHTAWHAVAPGLAERFRVIRYDRRGYGRSGRPPGPRTRRQDEDDVAGLIEALDCSPAHVVGSSFGASAALALAARRPELFRSLSLHEPPLIGAASESPPLRPLLAEVLNAILRAIEQLRAGDLAGGAKRFVEDVALGPGAWQMLPPEVREQLIRNAPGFLGDVEDPAAFDLDLVAAARVGCPLLVTHGSESPRWLQEVAAFVAGRIDGAQARTLAGAGHLPHETDPEGYRAVVEEFIASARATISR